MLRMPVPSRIWAYCSLPIPSHMTLTCESLSIPLEAESGGPGYCCEPRKGCELPHPTSSNTPAGASLPMLLVLWGLRPQWEPLHRLRVTCSCDMHVLPRRALGASHLGPLHGHSSCPAQPSAHISNATTLTGASWT